MSPRSSNKRAPILALTPGDPDGIGPEILWKTILARSRNPHPPRATETLLCVGAREPFDRMGIPVVEVQVETLARGDFSRPPRRSRPYVWLVAAPPGPPGFQAGWSIETAVSLVKAGVADALVTGPIHKERLQAGGYPFPGHTEFLASLCAKGKVVPEVTMMLANEKLRVSLVTIHTSLAKVPRAVTRAAVRRTVLHTAEALGAWWGVKKPRIAVAALNPHAGEGGLFGREEIDILIPELTALRRLLRNVSLEGPLPADTLFAKHVEAPYDAVVCMYHDQGLIPVKLLDFRKTVNVTLGLPIVRTSVDHGTGFDIVGTGKADPSSLQSAIRLAARIVRNFL